MRLHDGVVRFSRETPDRPAVIAGEETWTYAELDRMANKLSRAFIEYGASKGDRIAIWLEKSPLVICIMQACSRIGAIYVPIDPNSPAHRAELILNNCSVSLLVTTEKRANELTSPTSTCLYLSVDGGPSPLSWNQINGLSSAPLPDPGTLSTEPAYILHTSGSTGQPKGVTVSHRNALAFVLWAIKELNINSTDRLANHASFHFDLSVLDIYGALFSGASVYLIPEENNFSSTKLVQFIEANNPTIWYSVPSVLLMMMEYGDFLSIKNPSIRVLIFAGEVFPVRHLRSLRNRWPHMRMFNFYGPTETNVCTYYEVHSIDAARMSPVPIGKPCPYSKVWAEKNDGTIATCGEIGELIVGGETVMIGYWGKSSLNVSSYRTGDLVVVLDDGGFEFYGRMDQMVKVKGQRIELGEITAILQSHNCIDDAAVIVSGEGLDAKLIAILVSHNKRMSLLQVKEYCSQYLPKAMIIDGVRYVSSLPRTSTGKLDKLQLQEQYR